MGRRKRQPQQLYCHRPERISPNCSGKQRHRSTNIRGPTIPRRYPSIEHSRLTAEHWYQFSRAPSQINNVTYAGTNPRFGIVVSAALEYYPCTTRDSQCYTNGSGPGTGASVTAYSDMELVTFNGDPEFVSSHHDFWYVDVLGADIGLPWWLSAAILALGVILAPFGLAAASFLLLSFLTSKG
jgi:hypothetical protein